MPRVLNVMLAIVLLLLVSPIVTNFGGKPVVVQVALVLCSLPIVFVAGLCVASAARPGSLGRTARRLRPRGGRRRG